MRTLAGEGTVRTKRDKGTQSVGHQAKHATLSAARGVVDQEEKQLILQESNRGIDILLIHKLAICRSIKKQWLSQ